jgi:hypothetical protein
VGKDCEVLFGTTVPEKKIEKGIEKKNLQSVHLEDGHDTCAFKGLAHNRTGGHHGSAFTMPA